MKARSIQIIEPTEFKLLNLPVGYGTRPQVVISKPRGRLKFLLKGWSKHVGEIRSEVLASNIGKALGFAVQECSLATIEPSFLEQMRTVHEYKGNETAVLCKLDVRSQRTTSLGLKAIQHIIHGAEIIDLFLPGYAGSNASLRRKQYTTETIDKSIQRFEKMHPESELKFKEQFFEMMIFDAIIGGSERHDFNWGVLISSAENKFIRMTKLFDNGISLLWNLDRPGPIHSTSRLKGHILFQKQREKYFKNGLSVVRNNDGGRMSLFEACKVFKNLGYYPETKLSTLLQKLEASNRTSRLRHAIIDMLPRDPKFGLNSSVLGWIYEYVCYRIEFLINELV